MIAADLDHVALAAEHTDLLWPRYAGDLGGQWQGGGFTSGFYSAQVSYRNGMKVEGLRPERVEENDFLRRFLDRSGPGPHHLTFKVPDLRAALAECESVGLSPVGISFEDPGWFEAFLHPKVACGIVVQLAQSNPEGTWEPDAPPPGFPTARVEPARLDAVVLAVPELTSGLGLFRDLLGGEPVGQGQEAAAPWVELAWPGPGRIRLQAPGRGEGDPVREWLGDRPGRLHHLAFTTEHPEGVPDARPLADGRYELAPGANLGTRLVLSGW